jgi:phage repressor protein C with HTH and peptisase S24 domain
MRLQGKTCDNGNGTEFAPAHNGGMDAESIRKGLMRPGKSQRGLAHALGVDPSAVNRLLKGTRQLKAAEVQKVEAYLNAPSGSAPINDNRGKFGTFPATNASVDAGLIEVLGMAECGPDGWSLWNGEVVDRVPRPPNLAGVPKSYAVYIVGTSMEDRYHPGELAYIHPGKPVTPGCYVLVQIHPKEDGEPPRAVLKRLVKRSGDKVVLAQLSPAKTFTIKADEILSMHRVVGSGEA